MFLKLAIVETLFLLVPAVLYVAGKSEGLNCTGWYGIHKNVPVENPAGKSKEREGSRFKGGIMVICPLPLHSLHNGKPLAC